MAIIRINKNNSYYEVYHIPESAIAAETERLSSAGLLLGSSGEEPTANTFTVSEPMAFFDLQHEDNLMGHVA